MILIRFVFELQTAFHDNTGDSLDIFSTQDFCRFGEQLAYAASTQLVDQFNQSFVIAEETDQQVIAESINFLYDANNSLVRQKQQQQQQQQRQQLNHQYSRPVQLEPALKLQHLDYRYGRISIDWMDARSSDMKPTAVTHLKPTANKRQRRAAKAAAVAEPSEYLPFVSGHTDLNYGILRFYRNQHRAIDSIAGDDKLTVLAVLAVPTFMSIADYMQFIRPFDSQISHFRIVHDSQPNRYMVLMKFRDAAAAADFYQQMNGRAFSPMRVRVWLLSSCSVTLVA
jgi:hypothetical protein